MRSPVSSRARGERPETDSRHIGLAKTDDGSMERGARPSAAQAPRRGRGRRDVRIRPVVDIQQDTLTSLSMTLRPPTICSWTNETRRRRSRIRSAVDSMASRRRRRSDRLPPALDLGTHVSKRALDEGLEPRGEGDRRRGSRCAPPALVGGPIPRRVSRSVPGLFTEPIELAVKWQGQVRPFGDPRFRPLQKAMWRKVRISSSRDRRIDHHPSPRRR